MKILITNDDGEVIATARFTESVNPMHAEEILSGCLTRRGLIECDNCGSWVRDFQEEPGCRLVCEGGQCEAP